MRRIGAVVVTVVVAVLLAVVVAGQSAAPAPAPGLFAWKGEDVPFASGPESLGARIREVVETRLAALGCSPAVGVPPDLYVIARVARRDPEAPVSGLAALVVDLVDAPSSRLEWRSADSDLSGAALAQASVARGRTYAWREVPSQDGEQPPFVQADRHIRNAMEAVMLFRSWKVASEPAAADVFIAYRVMASGGKGKGKMVATLAVELQRRGASAVEWRGERTVKVPKPAKLEDAVIEAVVEIARDYRDGKPSTTR
jgi:hypothetical protein